MDIEEMFKEVKSIAKAGHSVQAGTLVTHELRQALIAYCAPRRLSLRQGLDLAIYSLLIEKADLSKLLRAAEDEQKKPVDTSRQCGKCFSVYQTAEYASCPHC